MRVPGRDVNLMGPVKQDTLRTYLIVLLNLEIYRIEEALAALGVHIADREPKPALDAAEARAAQLRTALEKIAEHDLVMLTGAGQIVALAMKETARAAERKGLERAKEIADAFESKAQRQVYGATMRGHTEADASATELLAANIASAIQSLLDQEPMTERQAQKDEK